MCLHEVVMHIYDNKKISEYDNEDILPNKYTIWLLNVKIKIDFNAAIWI